MMAEIQLCKVGDKQWAACIQIQEEKWKHIDLAGWGETPQDALNELLVKCVLLLTKGSL